MILPILLYGDKLLSEKSKNVSINKNVKDLIDNMCETMVKANGIGLAAVQVAVPLRMFVAKINDENKVFINPIVKESGNLAVYSESCLSVPMVSAFVSRHETIEINYYDENWQQHNETFDGFVARIIQHEYDHLEGTIYVDRVDNKWKQIIQNNLENIKQRKIKPYYLTK
jgi:peptide deformylase